MADTNVSIAFAAMFAGVDGLATGTAAVLANAQPLLILLPAWLLYGERVTARTSSGLTIGFIGFIGFIGLVVVAVPWRGGSRASISILAAITSGTLLPHRLVTGERPGGWTTAGRLLVLASLRTVIHSPECPTRADERSNDRHDDLRRPRAIREPCRHPRVEARGRGPSGGRSKRVDAARPAECSSGRGRGCRMTRTFRGSRFDSVRARRSTPVVIGAEVGAAARGELGADRVELSGGFGGEAEVAVDDVAVGVVRPRAFDDSSRSSVVTTGPFCTRSLPS